MRLWSLHGAGTSQAALQEALLETVLAQLADSGQHHRVDAMWPAGMALLLQSQSQLHIPGWLLNQHVPSVATRGGSLRHEGQIMWAEKPKPMTTLGKMTCHSSMIYS